MGRSLALRRTFEKSKGISWTHSLGACDWLAAAVRAKRRERPAALFYPAPRHHGFARPSHWCALESSDEKVPIAGPHLRAFPSGVAGTERREVQAAMSDSSRATENRAPKAIMKSPSKKDLSAVRMVLGPGIMYSATTLITMVLAIAVMVTLSPSLTLWVLLPAPVVAVAVWFFGKTIHELYEKIQAAHASQV